ncbi:MAG TPA: response regulator [Burkholderiaceae bacterium]
MEVAKLLGMAVRSVQLMVDRGDLQAWKTPGGHRRISRASVDAWIAARRMGISPPVKIAHPPAKSSAARGDGRKRVLLIEDSRYFQNFVKLLLQQHYPDLETRIADDGIAGLAMVGEFKPHVLIVDILLPGIDGATLVTSLRSHPQFEGIHLVVITTLDEKECAPYAFALSGVPLIQKPDLMKKLPALLQEWIGPVAATA